MIYQVPFNLDIENKAVQVVIDFETGFVGFSERLRWFALAAHISPKLKVIDIE